MEEENHIKDVLSRIVVEMIKREWPQHWPDMLIELDTLSKQGVWNITISVHFIWGACSRVCFVNRKELFGIPMVKKRFQFN